MVALLASYPLSSFSLTHQHGLLDQGVAVLTHVLEHLVGGGVAGGDTRLAGHGERVDQGLRVLFADVDQQLVNQSAYIRARRVNTSNQLRDYLK